MCHSHDHACESVRVKAVAHAALSGVHRPDTAGRSSSVSAPVGHRRELPAFALCSATLPGLRCERDASHALQRKFLACTASALDDVRVTNSTIPNLLNGDADTLSTCM